MSYVKQNFSNGQTLMAEHLNHMEDGISALEETAELIKSDKQDVLRSGENIRTINGQSLLGNGDIVISGVSVEYDNMADSLLYEPGSFDANNGGEINHEPTIRVRTSRLSINDIDALYLDISNKEYLYGWHMYDANDVQIGGSTAWLSDAVAIDVSKGYYIRFNFKKADDTELTPDDIINYSGFTVSKKPIEAGYTDGGTVSKYIGKIFLESNFTYKKYLTGYTPAAPLPSTTLQGMSVYNDKAFLLYNGGGLAILDLKTKFAISEFTLDTANSTNHCNSCNFSNEFYSGNTAYPLLYISECYGEHRCFVENITDSGSELIQTISFDNGNGDYSNATWGVAFDWILDNEASLLMIYGVMSDGRHKIKVFHKPDTSTAVINFTEDDVIDQWIVEDALPSQGESNFISQGSCAKNGSIYLITFTPSKILCIDEKTHAITAEVDVSFITDETEGIAIQADTMFISTASWEGAGSSIFTFSFN